MAKCSLDLRGDRFGATGRARRNPIDPPKQLIGEKLAIAGALNKLEHQITRRPRTRSSARQPLRPCECTRNCRGILVVIKTLTEREHRVPRMIQVRTAGEEGTNV